MPKIDIAKIAERNTSGYPDTLKSVVAGRFKKSLGDAAGLTQFGVQLTRIAPGSSSALRHWHETEDEFVFVLDGQIVLLEGDMEALLVAGEAAGFKAGVAKSHCLINRSDRDALLIEIGTRSAMERVHFTDVGLVAENAGSGFRFTPSGD